MAAFVAVSTFELLLPLSDEELDLVYRTKKKKQTVKGNKTIIYR